MPARRDMVRPPLPGHRPLGSAQSRSLPPGGCEGSSWLGAAVRACPFLRRLRTARLAWRLSAIAIEIRQTRTELNCCALLEPAERLTLHTTLGNLRRERDRLLAQIAESRG